MTGAADRVPSTPAPTPRTPRHEPAGGRSWLALSAVLAGLALTLWLSAAGTAAATWDWQPGLALTQPWRWWTAAGVHLSALHLGANLLGTALVAALGAAAGCDARATLAWAAAWPLTQLGLLVQPTLAHYAGLSGVLHAGVAVAAVQLIAGERGRRRWIGVALLAGLAAKLLLEAPWQAALRLSPGWDFAVAPLAHASGSAAGLLCAVVALVDRPRR